MRIEAEKNEKKAKKKEDQKKRKEKEMVLILKHNLDVVKVMAKAKRL